MHYQTENINYFREPDAVNKVPRAWVKTKMKTNISKDAVADCKIIDSVIDAYRLVQDRVKKLDGLGFYVRQQWVGSGGIGTIRKYDGVKGIQISGTTASCAYAGLAYVAYPAGNTLSELQEGRRWYGQINKK